MCAETPNWPAYYPEQRFTRPVLFLLNPHGGSGRALELFKNVINPALYEAGIEYSLFITGARAVSRAGTSTGLSPYRLCKHHEHSSLYSTH